MDKESREGPDPERILDRRLAQGEIDRSEYEALRAALAPRPHRVSGGGVGGVSTPLLVAIIAIAGVVSLGLTAWALTYGPWSPHGGGWGWGGGMMGDGAGEEGRVVLISQNAFAPERITVPVGATVTWWNMDGVSHTVTMGEHGEQHPMGAMDSGLMGHMGRWSQTFNTPGVFEYHCDSHPYMTGTVVVEGLP